MTPVMLQNNLISKLQRSRKNRGTKVLPSRNERASYDAYEIIDCKHYHTSHLQELEPIGGNRLTDHSSRTQLDVVITHGGVARIRLESDERNAGVSYHGERAV